MDSSRDDTNLAAPDDAMAGAISPGEEVLDRYRRIASAVLAPVAFFAVYLTTGDALTPPGRKLASILAGVGVLWVGEALPLAVTALLGAVLCVVLGVAGAKTVLASFADPIVFLFIGSFMLARAMTIHRLDQRIALGFLSLRWVGASPVRMMAGMGLVTGLLSMWVSNTATTAMMAPIALGILGALHEARVAHGLARGPMDARSWPYASGMMLMVAYAASVGGIGTPVGSPPNLIGIGLIRNSLGVRITFFQWMELAVPMLVVMGAVLLGLMWLMHPDRSRSGGGKERDRNVSPDLTEYMGRGRRELGPWTRGQVNTLIAFGVAVLLWVLPGVLGLPIYGSGPMAGRVAELGKWLDARLPEAIAALVGAILLFVLPVDLRRGRFTLTWGEAVRIDWGTILLFGGGLSLGTLMFETGVARALGGAIAGKMGVSGLWSLTAVSILIGILLSELTSNTASATMVIPVAIALASAAGVSPVPPALGACLGASYGFMLPVSTPPNAIVYGSGLVSIPRMMRAGIVFDLMGFVIIWAGLRVLCPAMGLM